MNILEINKSSEENSVFLQFPSKSGNYSIVETQVFKSIIRRK